VTAYNSQVHTSTKEIPFSFVSPRRIPTLALERFSHHDSDVRLSAEDTKVQFIEHLKELLPRVRKTLAKSQALYKKKFDARVLVKNRPHQGYQFSPRVRYVARIQPPSIG